VRRGAVFLNILGAAAETGCATALVVTGDFDFGSGVFVSLL
jgi:hypothetical protein